MNIRTNLLGEMLYGPFGMALEREILPAWLLRQRWFRSKSRPLAPGGVTVEARVPLGEWPHAPLFTIVRVNFADSDAEGGTERYALPLVVLSREDAAGFPEGSILGALPIAIGDDENRGNNSGVESVLCDACWHDGFREAWMEVLAGKRICELPDGTLRGHPLHTARTSDWSGPSRVLGGEQSNTAFVSAGIFVKLYRRLEEGVHPEPEMLRFLREHTDYRGVPGFLSCVEWQHGGHGTFTTALAQELVAGEDAWTHTLDLLRTGSAATGSTSSPADATERVASLGSLLGRRVGALHAALGSRPDFPAFAREPLTGDDLDAVRTNTRAQLYEALQALEAAISGLPPAAAALAPIVLASRPKFGELISRAGSGSGSSGGFKIRTHGDLHLGQILVSGDDALILDFEGEPGRPLAAARAKQSPLRDAAGMLRSFHYAAHVALREAQATNPPALREAQATNPPAAYASNGADGVGAAFLREYYAALEPSGLLPEGERARRALLDLFVLEKAVYELHYELNNRPDWAEIPLRGLFELLRTSEIL